jgi:hypothetical protein
MADAQQTQGDDLQQEGIARLAQCRFWKSLWDLDLRECYFFATPQRQRTVQSYSQPPKQRLLDAAELNTDIAFELCGDFATEVINTYLPEAQAWCETGKGMFVSVDEFKRVEKVVKDADTEVFGAILASNFYAELGKAFDPDLAIGTVGLWINVPRPGAPIEVLAVPIHEFEINLGPDGNIDDRFVIRWTRNSYVRTLLGEDIWANVNEEIKKACREKPADRTELRWGFWRLWDKATEDVVWQHVVYVKNDLVHSAELRGEGSCPLIMFRWNPNPDWPWGHGPIMQYLPTLRQIDEMEINRSEHAEISLKPPMGYPDDSFAAVEQGFEPGMAYPLMRGSGADIKPLWVAPPPEAANYQYEEKEHRLRKGFFVDFPQQTGDTPPTLGQWLDEMARAQRRIGRPGLAFWREGPLQIFLRYRYLLERQKPGSQAFKVDGKTISVMPYNPAQRAAEQQEIAMAVHGLQLCAQFWPEEFKVQIDGKETMMALLEKMRVKLVKFRPKEQVDAVVNQMQKLIGGTPPGGRQAASQPGTAPQAPAQAAGNGAAPPG